jgi:hypothetical protein
MTNTICDAKLSSPGYRRSEAQYLVLVVFVAQQSFGVECMVSLNMHSLIHWFVTNESVLAVLVTVGVAVLLVCCLECSKCPHRDKDDIFRRREI